MKFAENLYYPAYRKYLVDKIKLFTEKRDTMGYFSPNEIDSLVKVFNRDLEALDARQYPSQVLNK
jgi:hypothetical protein